VHPVAAAGAGRGAGPGTGPGPGAHRRRRAAGAAGHGRAFPAAGRSAQLTIPPCAGLSSAPGTRRNAGGPLASSTVAGSHHITGGVSMLDKAKTRLLGAVLVLASPLLAAEASAERISGREALAVMRAMDLSPELGTDSHGDPQIEFMIEGLHARLNFYDCKKQDGRCGSLQLETALDLEDGTSLRAANEFNQKYRYVRLYLDHEMDPYLQFDFEVLHTDAKSHLESQIELYGKLLRDFKDA